MRRWVRLGAAVIAGLILWDAGRRDLHGLSLVMRAGDVHGLVRHVANLDTVSVREQVLWIPAGHASIRARMFAPIGTSRQLVLLVPGLHPAGIDKPRLVELARKLAEANVAVVTPEIPELSHFEITPILTDRIEQAAPWLATDSGVAPTGRIGLMEISFSGGLAVVAAGRPSLRHRLLYVFSLGGHDDLRRVLEYYCGGGEFDRATYGELGCGATPPAGPPHDYGLAVALLNVADHLVPPEQVAPLRDGIRRLLSAAYLDTLDKPSAAGEFRAQRALARTLPDPAATLLRYVNDRDVAHLGPLLAPYISAYVDARSLSPSQSPLPSVPVFLLHGRDDTVIPAAESQYMATRLRGRVPVRLLITGLISHAEADQPPHVGDILRLARFWGDLLARWAPSESWNRRRTVVARWTNGTSGAPRNERS